eukprot:scaffold11481_cov109-Skeletonema_menzelii.AAC.2
MKTEALIPEKDSKPPARQPRRKAALKSKELITGMSKKETEEDVDDVKKPPAKRPRHKKAALKSEEPTRNNVAGNSYSNKVAYGGKFDLFASTTTTAKMKMSTKSSINNNKNASRKSSAENVSRKSSAAIASVPPNANSVSITRCTARLSTASGSIPPVAADVKKPPKSSPVTIDDLMENNIKEVFGAAEKITEYDGDRDILYDEVKAYNGFPRGKGESHERFINKVSTKLLGDTKKSNWYFEALHIVNDQRRNGTRFLCWNDDLKGYYDLGDKRVITLLMSAVHSIIHGNRRMENGGDDDDEEGGVEKGLKDDDDNDLFYDRDDIGNMVDPDGNLLHSSGEMGACDEPFVPSQEVVIGIKNEVDNNGNTATGLLEKMTQHVAEKERNGEFANLTQCSHLGLTPVDGEKASAEQAFEELTKDGALDNFAESLSKADEEHSLLYKKSDGGSKEEYRAGLSLLLRQEQRFYYQTNSSMRGEVHQHACKKDLQSNLQKLIAKERLKEQEGDSSSFMRRHVYSHLPVNSMKADQPGGEPVEIQAHDLKYVVDETVVFPTSDVSNKDKLQHLMAPDELGSAMPLCLTGETIRLKTRSRSNTKFCKYSDSACDGGFIVGYPCTMCNPNSVRRVFGLQPGRKKPVEYDNNVAALGFQLPKHDTVPNKNGKPNYGLVGIHSWITTGYCSCDGKFYCFNCWPKHVEDKWNEDNPERECIVKSNHEYQIRQKRVGTKCAGSNCGLKIEDKKCCCQPDSKRYCEGCYVDHCIDHLKQAIDNTKTNDERSSEPQGNLKKDEDYPN